MSENEDLKDYSQQLSIDPTMNFTNPKRDFKDHCQTIYDKDQHIESFANQDVILLKNKHQNLIINLMKSSGNQNPTNRSQTYKNKHKEKQKEKSFFFDQLVSSTQQESCSIFSQRVFFQNDSKSQIQDKYKQRKQSSQPIEDLQNTQQIFEEDKNQSKQSLSENESQDQGSILFIPFEKTQQQIIALKNKQLQLMKSYTPLSQSQVLPWLNQQIKSIQDPIIRFHQQIRSFYYYLKPSKQQHEKRMQIFAQIKVIILSIYPQAKVFPFGSFATGLYLPDGDIDTVALIENQTSDRQKTKQFYKKIYQQFRQNYRSKFTQITFIQSAKTPLVKMYHRKTGFSIDISLNTLAGLQQITEVDKMTRHYPEFKFIIFVLKVMLKIRNLNETFSGGIGSFLLVCMVFHFLRYFHERSRPHQNKLCGLGELILNFFRFYFVNVDFFKQTINIKSGNLTMRPRKKNSLSILSPLDQKTDIGKKAWKMRDILCLFKNRHKMIVQRHFQFGQSILKQLINPTMDEFQYYQLKKDKSYIQEQKDEFMENFSKKLIQEIQTIIKKNPTQLSLSQQEKKTKKRKYYKVDRTKNLKQGQKNDIKEKQEYQYEDSTSY